MLNLLPSEYLDLKYGSPHMVGEIEGASEERELYRITEYYERERDDYVRQGEFTYSNPISL